MRSILERGYEEGGERVGELSWLLAGARPRLPEQLQLDVSCRTSHFGTNVSSHEQ